MQFEYYVLNYNFNEHKVEMFNVFWNWNVQEWAEKEIKKYLRAPRKYKKQKNGDGEALYGFDALCDEIRSIIMWQEWSRREYEISVGDAFETDCNKLEKWDCYDQCVPNIKMITRDIIRQYKEQLKEVKEDGSKN